MCGTSRIKYKKPTIACISFVQLKNVGTVNLYYVGKELSSGLTFVIFTGPEMVTVADWSTIKDKANSFGNLIIAEHSLIYFTWHLGSAKAWQRLPSSCWSQIQYRWERSTGCDCTNTDVLVKTFLYSSFHLFCPFSFMILFSESLHTQSITHMHMYTLLLRPGNHKLCLSPYQNSH